MTIFYTKTGRATAGALAIVAFALFFGFALTPSDSIAVSESITQTTVSDSFDKVVTEAQSGAGISTPTWQAYQRSLYALQVNADAYSYEIDDWFVLRLTPTCTIRGWQAYNLLMYNRIMSDQTTIYMTGLARSSGDDRVIRHIKDNTPACSPR